MSTREKTEKKVFSYIEAHHMIEPDEKIVAGVSGGADSVCLLLLLLAYGNKAPLSLAVVHVNHGIRPEAGEDGRYVEELCRRHDIPFFLTEADVNKFAREEKCSEEDAGRRLRYEAFRRAAESLGSTKIAVAHNGNDNAETMLFHLFRGSGIRGLSGIMPVRRDGSCGVDIIRPILCLERREVEEYLRERGVPWRVDSTNFGDDYRRNRIRHHILPYAEQEIAAGAVSHMCRTADLLRETEDYLILQTKEALKKCLVPETQASAALKKCLVSGEQELATGEGGVRAFELDVKSFENYHTVLRKRMLLAVIEQLSPAKKDISAVHIQDVLTLFTEEKHREIMLPFGIRARRQYGRVILEREKAAACPGLSIRVPLTEALFRFPVTYDMGSFGQMEFSGFSVKKGKEVSKNRYTKWFDYDKIEGYVVIRTREQGDFLTIADGAGNTVHKSLKRYMITEKIPEQQRDEIPVVAVGNHVLWLVGFRISESFKVDGNTKRILQVSFSAKRENTENIESIDCKGSETEEENVRTH